MYTVPRERILLERKILPTHNINSHGYNTDNIIILILIILVYMWTVIEDQTDYFVILNDRLKEKMSRIV